VTPIIKSQYLKQCESTCTKISEILLILLAIEDCEIIGENWKQNSRCEYNWQTIEEGWVNVLVIYIIYLHQDCIVNNLMITL